MLNTIKSALDASFSEISNEFNAEGVTVLMPTYAPTQGRLMSEFARVGGAAHIAGGKKDSPAFKNVPQYGLNFDTTAYINMFPAGMNEKIVGAVPEALLRDRKVAIFSFIPPAKPWASYIAQRGLNTQVVASNEQNTRLFFEKKGNLQHILQQAGLGAYVIPSTIVEPGAPFEELREVYQAIRSYNGKVVVQATVENYEPTAFITNEDDFLAKVSASKLPLKVARFIEGSEANLSFFAGNMRPADEGRGVTKSNLPEGIDCDDPQSLALIQANAAAKGIDESNVFSLTGRATLKAVGDSLLANERGDSVGNNIGHVYPPHIAAQISEVGAKIGHLMALSGKVGLAGADLLIDKQGKIWINEINDRQQGPTDQMSADAEKAGLPGLSRLSWFSHFGDFNRVENVNLLAAIRDNADAIHQQYMTTSGSFYIKAYANHGAEFNGQVVALRDLPAGNYTVQRKKGVWVWGDMDPTAKAEPIDLSRDRVVLTISGGGFAKGEATASGAELFRITGVASGDNSPFIIENGVSRLSPAWAEIIRPLYEECFGKDYIAKNPLNRPGAPANKNEPVGSNVVSLAAARKVGARA